MAVDIGARIGIDGEKAFRDSLGAINSQLKNLGSEMKVVVAEFAGMEDSEEAVAAKSDVLKRSIAASADKIEALQGQSERARKKLDALAAELDNANRNFDRNSKEVIAAQNAYNRQVTVANKLETQINQTTAEMKKMEREMKQLGNAADDLSDDLKKVGQSAEDAKDEFMGSLGGNILSAAIQTLVSGMIDLAESTMEYRKVMGTLEVSGQKAGYTAEETAQTYEQLYGVLGDSQQAATAAANLQALGLSQEQLKQMTEGAIGAWATYGDSIPIDSLAEAINETVQAGVVTGSFADVLNWAGASEDAFNAKLEAAGSQAERANLVLQELSKQGLMETAAGWRENNEEIVAANEAAAGLEETTGRLDEMLSPMVTSLKESLNDVLSTVLDMVEQGHPLISIVTGLAVALASLGLAMFITQGAAAADMLVKMKTAFIALNTAMKANPILLVVSLLAGLTAALITAYQTNEEFRNKVNAAWEAVKSGIGEGVEKAKGFIEDLKIKFSSFIDWVKGLPAELKTIGGNIVDGLLDGILGKWKNLESRVSDAVNGLKNVFTRSDGFDTNSPSKWAKKVGGWVMEGLGAGIEADQTAMAAAKAATENVKGVFGEAAAEISDMTLSAADGMEAAMPQIRRTAQNVGNLLEKELSKVNAKIESIQKEANEEQAEAELRQYQDSLAEKYKELEKAEKKNKQKILDEIAEIEAEWNKKQIDAARNAEQQILQERLTALRQFQQEYESAISSIEGKQSSVQEKIADYGFLFERVQTEEGKELFRLGDLDAEIKKIQKYSEAIDQMKQKGLSGGLLEEISSMNIDDALEYMDRLSAMTEKKFAQYLQQYEEKQRLAAQAAGKFYQAELELLEKSYAKELPQALNDAEAALYQFGEAAAENLQAGMTADGSDIGKKITSAVTSAVSGAKQETAAGSMEQIILGMQEQYPVLEEYIETTKEEIIALIESYWGNFRNVGEDMMLGVAQGIRDGRSAVVNAVAAVIAAAVARVKADLDINSPSKVFAEIGGYMAAGLDEGWRERMKAASNNISRSMNSLAAPTMQLQSAAAGGSRTYSYGDINVYVDKLNNANGRDTQILATELEFHRRQQAAGRGGKW